jgi:DNA-directed RNA polymerase subunit beta
VPESFKVLIKELQSLALDIKVLSDTRDEIFINEDEDEEAVPIDVNIAGLEDIPAFAAISGEEDDMEDFDDFEDLEIPEEEAAVSEDEIDTADESLNGLDEDLGELSDTLDLEIDKDIE